MGNFENLESISEFKGPYFMKREKKAVIMQSEREWQCSFGIGNTSVGHCMFTKYRIKSAVN